jgi:GT2 family glycosyltransferase
MPLVSVVIPTFNRTAYLSRAIDSVCEQSFHDWELIIADDGSSSETADYLRSLSESRIRILWLQHSGNPARVRNVAIQSAQSRYLAFLDSDDLWRPEKLAKQIKALEGNPNARWSYTLENRIDAGERPWQPADAGERKARSGWIFPELLRLEIAISMPAIVVERELARAIGGFDERQRFGEWHDFGLRLAAGAEAILVPEVLCSIRAHDEHFSADRVAALTDWMQLYEKFGRLAPSQDLRDHCARMRARTALELARHEWRSANFGRAIVATVRALPILWHPARQ